MRFTSIAIASFLTLGLGLSSAVESIATAASNVPETVFTYDARALNQLDLAQRTNAARIWDTMHLLSAVQGLANRSRPRFYLFYCSGFGVDTDQFWFDWLRGEDGWLKNAKLRALGSVEEVLAAFTNDYSGLVVYDESVPATALAASTAGGLENLLPVRYDRAEGSLYHLLRAKLRIPVKLWLINPDGTRKFSSQGKLPDFEEASGPSSKIDVYRWLIRRYIEPRRCVPGMAAYYVDAFWLQHPTRADHTMHTLSNHDYFIAHRAPFFDLSPWVDEIPNDDPLQSTGADQAMLAQLFKLLQAQANNQMVKVGGFVPWPFKYTTHSAPPGKHDGVPTEWEFARIISEFKGYMEADAAGLAAMANASFFQHYPLKPVYKQPNPKPGLKEWRERALVSAEGRLAPKLFVGHYVGDYDAPSWLYKAVAAFFADPHRGEVPLGWAFDPNLADRAPQALVYAYRHATSNDFFIAGDSGAGYLNPRCLSRRTEPDSALSNWAEHCRSYFQQWDMSITGFILDGAGGASTETEYRAYRTFSPDGAGTHFLKQPQVIAGLPTCPERDLPDDVSAAAKLISDLARDTHAASRFLWARSILKTPGWYSDLRKRTDELCPGRVVYVDPYTFFGLVRLSCEREESERSQQDQRNR